MVTLTFASSAAGVQMGGRDPVGPIQRVSATTVTTTIWAGYAAAGSAGQFNSVTANWSVPTASCAGVKSNAYSSFWVGLDGFNSRTVEQTGTDSDCINGTATYFAWYEFYPKKPVLALTLSPGDNITASVTYSNGMFTVSINDTSEINGGFSTTAAVKSALRSSAEVITEAPSSNHGPRSALPLADFGTVDYSGAMVNGDTLASSAPDEVVMQLGSTVKAQPSGIGSDGESFSVAWEHG
jgi:hypothetical protein